MANNRRKFRNYLIQPAFQYRYLTFLLVAALGPIIFSIITIHYFLTENYELLANLASLDEKATAVLEWEMKFLLTAIGGSFALFLFAIMFLGLIYSHRIAGVIYKLRRAMQDVSAGKEVTLSFRDRDEFHDVADEFNKMVKTLKDTKTKKAS